MENFDKKLKDKINTYNSSVDPELIWQGIQKKRNRDRKRRIIPMFWFAAILILLIGIPVVFNLENIFSRKDITTELVKNNSNKNSVNKNTDEESDTGETINNSSTSSLNIDNNLYNSNLHTNKILNISSKGNNKETNIFNEKSEISDYKTNKNNISIIENNNDTLISNTKSGSGAIYLADNSHVKINTSLYQVIKINSDLNLTPQIFETKEKKKKDRKSSQICFAITPQYAFRQIKAADETSTTYAKNVQFNEKFLESFDINLLIKKPVYRSLYIASGLNYSQTDWKLDYTYMSSETYVDDSVLSRMVLNMPGDTIKYYSQKMVTANYEIQEKIFNYNRKIYIPIIIGYYGKIGKLNFDLNAGLDLALFDFSKGRIITPEGKTIDIKDPNNNLFHKSVLQNLRLSLTLQKRFSEKLFLNFGPEFKYGFNPYSDSSGLKTNDNTIGFKTCLLYKF
jgi:hypothetical protein